MNRTSAMACWTGPVLAALLLGAPPARAQGRSYRLNDPFPLTPGGDVSFVDVSADGAWLVYLADAEQDGVDNLWSAPADGSAAPQRITNRSDPGPFVTGITISPDGTRVLYMTTSSFPRRLYSVPIDGSAPPEDLVGPHVTAFQVTPDSSRVVFRGDIVTANRFVLCSVPVDGSAGPIVVSGPLAAGVDVEEFAIAPDGTRAAYRADANGDGRHELFSALVDASGGALQLSTGGVVRPVLRVSSMEGRVAYLADELNPGVVELFSVPIDGSSPAVRLNDPLSGNRDVQDDLVLSPDGSRAVYRANLSLATELFSAPIDGSAPAVCLCGAVVTGHRVYADPVVSADGSRVVYRADFVTSNVVELFGVPIDGSAAPVNLSGVLPAGEDVQAGFQIAPNGQRVAYLAGPTGASTLFSAPIDGSAPPLALDSDAQELFSDLAIGANGVRVVYEKPDASGTDLWSVPLDGSSAAFRLSGGNAAGAYWRMAFNGTAVFYAADEDLAGMFELFVRPANGSSGSFQVNPEFPDNVVSGKVLSVVAGGNRAVYAADPDVTDFVGLYSVPVSRRDAPIRISATSGPPILVSTSVPVAIGAGGARAVFLGISGVNLELYSALVDGGAGTSEPVVLDGPMQPGGAVLTFTLSPDGSQAVYLADQDTNDVFELYRAPVDGAASPVKLSGAMTSGGDVRAGFQPNADGSRVVYVADQDADERFELYSADGILPPVKLSGAMTAGGDVQLDPQLSLDGAWVFYRADALVDGRIELFRAPSAGGAGPIALSGTIVAGGTVRDGFRVTPDGARVLFRADSLVGGRIDLFTVPADGSAAPLKLNSGETSASDVFSILLDPAGSVAVIHYNPSLQNSKLYRVPVDGSAPQTLLTPIANNGRVYGLDESEGGSIPGIVISPDGTRVVYRANAEDFDDVELYSVPIDASAPPLKLNAPLVGFADIQSFRLDPAGRFVAYVAYPSPNRARLFAVPIDRAREPIDLTPALGASGTGVQSDYAFAPGGAVLFRLDPRQIQAFDLYAALLELVPRPVDTPDTTVTRTR